MSKFIVKIISITLSVIIAASSASFAFAQEPINSNQKTNIHYEKGSIEGLFDSSVARNDFKELVYTYHQNGESYRVYDQANNDLTNTNSFIYKVGLNGEEKLVRQEKVTVSNNIVYTTVTENGQEKTYTLDLNKNKELQIVPETRGTWAGYPVSDTFVDWGSFQQKYNVAGTTATAVSATIKAIVSVATGIDPAVKVVVSAITVVANYIFQNSIKWTYVIEDVAFRWTEIPTAAVQQRAVERTIRTFYTDSNYATEIDSVTTTAYAKDYKD